MKKEAFRASNLTLQDEAGKRLNGLNLSLLCGEVLGIYGISNSGKTALLNVILGKETAEGHVFYGGTPKSGSGKIRNVALITKETSLINSLTVWENLVVVRQHITSHVFLSPRFLARSTNMMLREYGCPFGSEAIVAELSPAMQFIAEIFKVWMAGASIILIDDFLSNFTAEELGEIKKVLDRLKAEGVSFLATCCRMEPLLACSDRVAFLSKGRILTVLENKPEYYQKLRLVMDMTAPELSLKKRKLVEAARRCFHISLKTAGGLSLDFKLKSGEICAVIDPARTELQWLRQEGTPPISVWTAGDGKEPEKRLKKGVLIREISVSDQIVPSLTPQDNICMGSYGRFSRLGFILKRRMRALDREFFDRYPDRTVIDSEDCMDITALDRAAIVMYRVFLRRPAVYAAIIRDSDMDRVTFNLVMHSIVELAEEGSAVCVMMSDTEYVQDFADRYILMENGRVQYDVPFKMIRGDGSYRGVSGDGE